MTTVVNRFDGISNGTTITTANSGGTSGDALDTAPIGSGGAIVADNVHVAHGAEACKITGGATAAATYFGYTSTGAIGSVATHYFRFYFYATANPSSATIRLYVCSNAAGNLCIISMGVGGVTSMSYGVSNTAAFSTPVISLNTLYRYEGFCTVSATVGAVGLATYLGDSLVPVTSPAPLTGLNVGSSNPLTYAWGNFPGIANYGTYWFDDVGISSDSPLGPAMRQFSGADNVRQAVNRASVW